jgi:membrane-bound ClpP family serine protease
MNRADQTLTNGIKAMGIFLVLAGIGAFAIALFVPGLIGTMLAILLIVGGAVRLTYALMSRSEVGSGSSWRPDAWIAWLGSSGHKRTPVSCIGVIKAVAL